MATTTINGRVGQVLGPFDAGQDLMADDGAIGMFTPEKTKPIILKLGIQTDIGTIVKINEVPIKIGKTGIYELDYRVQVKTLSFPSGANANTIIDFVY